MNLHQAPPNGKSLSRVSDSECHAQVSHSPDGAIVVRIERAATAPADELVPLSECGLEEKAWRKLVRSGELKARKIGRLWFSTRRALCSLVLDAPASRKRPVATSYADLVANAGSKR